MTKKCSIYEWYKTDIFDVRLKILTVKNKSISLIVESDLKTMANFPRYHQGLTESKSDIKCLRIVVRIHKVTSNLIPTEFRSLNELVLMYYKKNSS